MTDFSQNDDVQATPVDESAVAPAAVQSEWRVGVGTLMGRLSADADAAAAAA